MLSTLLVLCVAALGRATALRMEPRAAIPEEDTQCLAAAQVGQIQGASFVPEYPGCQFKGIPYALPPVGKLRFQAPQLKRNLTSSATAVFTATEYGAGCPQHCDLQHPTFSCAATTSEDCLFLNVYTPYLDLSATAMASNTPLPVMFFIHGGNFDQGAGGVDIYHGGRLATANNVVVVTINYRLGVLGGLVAADGLIGGNFNLRDQRLALQWVQYNIAAFGGNRELVTIFGQSAGGASVAAHLASPPSWPLFHRAIPQSNPVSLPTETVDNALVIGDAIAVKLGCTTKTNPPPAAQVEQCLMAASVDDIISAQRAVHFPAELHKTLHKFMPWTPIINSTELPMDILDAAKAGKINNVPIMTGTVANESIQFIWLASPTPLDKLDYDLLLDELFGLEDAVVIKKLYGKPPDGVKDLRVWLGPLGTDFIFQCATRYFANAIGHRQPVYLYSVYEFDHLLSFNFLFQNASYPECDDYVCHGSELPLLFGSTFLNASFPQLPATEEVLVTQLQTMWSNFARSGNPNEGTTIPVQPGQPALQIPLYDNNTNAVTHLNVPSGNVNNYRAQFCNVWDRYQYKFQ